MVDVPHVTPLRLFLCAILALLSSGCGTEHTDRKATFPVKGEVYVDGEPAADLAVTLHDVNGIDSEQPTISATRTDASGKFSVSTYEQGDGVPAGNYTLTFEWGEMNTFSMRYEGDKLNGKYKDPETSEHRVTVEEGKPTELGRIDLTTK